MESSKEYIQKIFVNRYAVGMHIKYLPQSKFQEVFGSPTYLKM